MESGKRILFLEKVFFKKNKKPQLRGVELFNFVLIKELAELGCEIELVAEESWKHLLLDELPEQAKQKIKFIAFKKCIHPVINVICKVFALGWKHQNSKSYDVLLLGNVGNILSPLIKILRMFKSFKKVVLIAHRETYPKFSDVLRKVPGHVVCVCSKIADGFRGDGFMPEIHTDYGIMNADRFYSAGAKAANRIIKFGVLGALDNAWKGADTAIAAFGLIPEELKSKAELHLMAYSAEPPQNLERGVIAYGWQSSSTVPDFLRLLDVLLVPSRDEEVMRETFSQATVQGMLTELPILYSDLPILKEKFDNGGGICCHSVQEFSTSMAKLIQNPELCLEYGKQARKTALERYVWSTKRFYERYIY